MIFCPEIGKEEVFRQICQTSTKVFRAASQTATEGLVLLPGCFELFALDFLIDTKGSVWLLEVNGELAIPKGGEARLLVSTWVVESITSITVQKLMQVNEKPLAKQRMIEVLNSEPKLSSIREIVY